jgi:hypothetical protein
MPEQNTDIKGFHTILARKNTKDNFLGATTGRGESKGYYVASRVYTLLTGV